MDRSRRRSQPSPRLARATSRRRSTNCRCCGRAKAIWLRRARRSAASATTIPRTIRSPWSGRAITPAPRPTFEQVLRGSGAQARVRRHQAAPRALHRRRPPRAIASTLRRTPVSTSRARAIRSWSMCRPPSGRSRQKSSTSCRRSGGSGRSDTNMKRSVRFGGGLRVYLERGWFSSGVGRAARRGVVEQRERRARRRDAATSSRRSSRSGAWIRSGRPGAVGRARRSDISPTLWRPTRSSRSRKRVRRSATGQPGRVDVVGFAPQFDPSAKLWFADLTIDLADGPTYSPFVRLALGALPAARAGRRADLARRAGRIRAAHAGPDRAGHGGPASPAHAARRRQRRRAERAAALRPGRGEAGAADARAGAGAEAHG